MMMNWRVLIFLMLCLATLKTQAQIYVDVSAGGANDGSTWTNAYTDLQAAINDANAATIQIWVAAGNYYPSADNTGNTTPGNNRTKTFYIDTEGTEIYGGFAGGETSLESRSIATNPTILSGDLGILNDNADNVYHVLTIDGTTVNGNITTATILDGIQIQDGNADGSSYPHNEGGGLFNNGGSAGRECSPTINDCIFSNNSGDDGGGAINNAGHNGGTSSPIITNCSFSQNTASKGGAMNNSGHSGGTSSPIITNCSFSQNTATNAGAINNAGHSGGTSSPTVTNCSFSQNTATNSGGGIRNNGSFGFSAANIINCSFSQNTANGSGGAILNEAYSGICNINIINCSFSENTAATGQAMFNIGNSGTCNPIITNSIFWGAGGSQIFSTNTTGSISYSIYPQAIGSISNMTNGGNNSTADPLYTNAATGDLTLQVGSPAIDAGNDAANSTTTDLANNPRKENTIDMGAFEFTTIVISPPGGASIPTVSEWGMLLLALMMMIATGLLYVVVPQKAAYAQSAYNNTHPNRQNKLPFDTKALLRLVPLVALGFVVVFSTAIAFFGYELTNADPIGTLLAIPMVSYLWFLLGEVGQQ